MKYTTLNEIKKNRPCSGGWEKLLAALNKKNADDEPISLKFILESNGLDDALWALRAVANNDRDAQLYAVWCIRQIQHLKTSRQTMNVIKRFNKNAARHAAWTAWTTRTEAERAAKHTPKYTAWAARDAAEHAQKAKFIEMFCQEDA